MKILVLEDDQVWQCLLRRAIDGVKGITETQVKSKGFLPLIRETVRDWSPDIVIMAWKDFGAGVLAEIRSASVHASQNLKVWVLTGYSPRVIHRSAEDADLVLQKGHFPPGVLELLLGQQVHLINSQHGRERATS